MVGSGCVTWQSKKQPTVALATAEAEYMATGAAEYLVGRTWLQSKWSDYHLRRQSGLYCYVQELSVSCSDKAYIDVRHHFVREKVQSNEVVLIHVSTIDMIADICTKGLHRQQFEKLRNGLGLVALPQQEGVLEELV
eukprot:GILJ01025123.1.p2 GENE.GILJ01025123.1~~GILJ01025123.1.p2  ORF type:complete len:137 (-),score=17.04 GILJ01025123.1:238-648(-)